MTPKIELPEKTRELLAQCLLLTSSAVGPIPEGFIPDKFDEVAAKLQMEIMYVAGCPRPKGTPNDDGTVNENDWLVDWALDQVGELDQSPSIEKARDVIAWCMEHSVYRWPEEVRMNIDDVLERHLKVSANS